MTHQSKLHPSENKFHKGNGEDKKHYWLTPPELYKQLDDEFHFDFDPCPNYDNPLPGMPILPKDFDGLTSRWGESNYINPPFGSIIHNGRKKGPTAWVRKTIEEHRLYNSTNVYVFPVDKWVLMLLKEMSFVVGESEVRNLGDVRWCATEDGSQGKGTGRHIACFILRPKL